MKISLVYAKTNEQIILTIEVKEGTNVADAIKVSNIQMVCADMDLTKCVFAVWGKQVDGDHELQEGDRLEICRELIFDPKTIRRQRAHRKMKS